MEFVCDSVMPTIHLGSRDHASIFVAYTGLRGFIIALVGVVTYIRDPKKTKKKTKGSNEKRRIILPCLRKEDRAAATRRWRERKKIEKKRETSSNLPRLATNPSSVHVFPMPGCAQLCTIAGAAPKRNHFGSELVVDSPQRRAYDVFLPLSETRHASISGVESPRVSQF
jgi:hypothetical protein